MCKDSFSTWRCRPTGLLSTGVSTKFRTAAKKRIWYRNSTTPWAYCKRSKHVSKRKTKEAEAGRLRFKRPILSRRSYKIPFLYYLSSRMPTQKFISADFLVQTAKHSKIMKKLTHWQHGRPPTSLLCSRASVVFAWYDSIDRTLRKLSLLSETRLQYCHRKPFISN